jgi:hypothetical protein
MTADDDRRTALSHVLAEVSEALVTPDTVRMLAEYLPTYIKLSSPPGSGADLRRCDRRCDRELSDRDDHP